MTEHYIVHRYPTLFVQFPACDAQADLAFVLDTSGSINSTNFATMKSFIQETIRGFKIGPSDMQFAVVPFSSDVDLTGRIWLNGYRDKNAVIGFNVVSEYIWVSHVWTVTWLDFYCVVSFYTIQSPNDQCGATVEIESRDCPVIRDLTRLGVCVSQASTLSRHAGW